MGGKQEKHVKRKKKKKKKIPSHLTTLLGETSSLLGSFRLGLFLELLKWISLVLFILKLIVFFFPKLTIFFTSCSRVFIFFLRLLEVVIRNILFK
jgi:hypothetical protein